MKREFEHRALFGTSCNFWLRADFGIDFCEGGMLQVITHTKTTNHLHRAWRLQPMNGNAVVMPTETQAKSFLYCFRQVLWVSSRNSKVIMRIPQQLIGKAKEMHHIDCVMKKQNKKKQKIHKMSAAWGREYSSNIFFTSKQGRVLVHFHCIYLFIVQESLHILHVSLHITQKFGVFKILINYYKYYFEIN